MCKFFRTVQYFASVGFSEANAGRSYPLLPALIMAKVITAGQILINAQLPEAYRDYDRVWTKKELESVLGRIAKERPGEYKEVSHWLLKVGNLFATRTAGFSPSVLHLRKSPVAKRIQAEYVKKETEILDDDTLSREEKRLRVFEEAMKASERQKKEVFEDALAKKNPFALQVATGAKGNLSHLNSLIGGDFLYMDGKGNPVPYTVLSSYGQGLRPTEMLAGSYGTRKGVTEPKLATRDAGYLSKQLVRAAHRGLVTKLDSDGPPDENRGLPASVDDEENIDSLLARASGGYPRNTRLTAGVLADLKKKGIEKILVRSPMVGGRTDGTLYARDAGYREHGRLPVPGENPSIRAVQALSEPLGQGALCLAKGTRVRMADGSTMKIEEIVPGDQVCGCDLRGNLFVTTVRNVFHNGVRDCREYAFTLPAKNTVVKIKCTPDHKILTALPGDE